MRLGGKRFYSALQDGLYRECGSVGLSKKMVVSMATSPLNFPKYVEGSSPRFVFTYFDDYLEYLEFVDAKFPNPDSRSFFEIVRGEKRQKPKFDMDFDCQITEQDALNQVLKVADVAITLLESRGVLLDWSRDLLIYSSNGDGEGKISYHIVLSGCYHNNNEEARAFFNAVSAALPPSTTRYLDHAVYNKTQAFRILGCQKPGSGRTKIRVPNFVFRGDEVKGRIGNKREEMALSLIERINSDFERIPSFIVLEPRPEVSFSWTASVSRKKLEKLIEMKFGNGAFEVQECDANIIGLIRLAPSFCPICNRIHHSENPYVLLSPKGEIRWYCRRNPDGRYLILGETDKVETMQEDNSSNVIISWKRPAETTTPPVTPPVERRRPPKSKRPSRLERGIANLLELVKQETQ